MTQRRFGWTTLCCGLCLSTSSVIAAGFALQEQSVSGLGNAFAGGAAAADDNSVIWTNPAALTLLESAELQLGFHYLAVDVDLQNTGTTTLGFPTLGADMAIRESVLVPNFYYSQPVSKDLVLGLGVSGSFGLTTDWGDSWFGRYLAGYFDLGVINIQPTLAYKVNDQFSIGIGLNAVHAESELSNALNMGQVFLDAIQVGLIPAILVPPGLISDVQANLGGNKYDGGFSIAGDGTGWGFNIGMLFQPTDRTRFGVHYRSEVEIELEGEADFRVGGLGQILGAFFPDQSGKLDLVLPAIANFSLVHQLSDRWEIMADAQYTMWSSFDALVVEFTLPTPPTSVIPEKWEDAWRFSAGASYQVTDALKIRGGVALDQSPVPSPQYRSPRIPDSDRTWISGGLEFAFTDNFRMNAGATFISVKDASIDNSTQAVAVRMRADMTSSITIVSIGGVYRF